MRALLLLCLVLHLSVYYASHIQHNPTTSTITDLSHLTHACFFPGADITDYMARHSSKRYESSGRWYSTTLSGSKLESGQPTTLTWSIVPDGTSIYGYQANEQVSPSNLDDFMTKVYGSKQYYLKMFEDSFSMWSNITGVNFVYLEHDDGLPFNSTSLPNGLDNVRGDIRIAGHPIDGDYGVLAYTFGPDFGDMVIDTSDIFYSENKDYTVNVFSHELGHALGLGHSCPLTNTKLLEPYFTTSFWGPQLDDIRGIQRQYGDKYENNNSPASASDLGTLSDTMNLTHLSLHASSDVDFFKFTVGSNKNITITVKPTGIPYRYGPVISHPGESFCLRESEQNSIDALQVFDLVFEILSSDGKTLLNKINETKSGQSESITLTLISGQSYLIKIYTKTNTSDSQDQIQTYELSLKTASTSNESKIPKAKAYISTTNPKMWAGSFVITEPVWTTITLKESFNDMVVVCSIYNTVHKNSMSVRMRNVKKNRFDIQVVGLGRNFQGPVDVDCVVVEQGIYTDVANGIQLEAHKITSLKSDGLFKNWTNSIPISFYNTYKNPVVVGQVMTSYDPNWSVFYAQDVSSTSSSNTCYIGKSVGSDVRVGRQKEQIGYIVVEAGVGVWGNRRYEALCGGMEIYGVDNSPPYVYNTSGKIQPSLGVHSANSMLGQNAGFSVFYGSRATAFLDKKVSLAFDGDQFTDSVRFNGSYGSVGVLLFE